MLKKIVYALSVIIVAQAVMAMDHYATMPKELIAITIRHAGLNDNDLLHLQLTSKSFSQGIDEEFKARALLKQPLVCLLGHPWPNMMSYFLRKRLEKLPTFVSKSQDALPFTEIYARCADFCHTWDFSGENLIRHMGKIDFEQIFNKINPTLDDYELTLFIYSKLYTTKLKEPETEEKFLKIAQAFVDSGKKEIAIYYTNSAASAHKNGLNSFSKNASKYNKFSADLGDAAGQFGLGIQILGPLFNYKLDANKDKYEEGLSYIQKAAIQEYEPAQSKLGNLFVSQGNLEEGYKYLILSANQGNTADQMTLGSYHKKIGDLQQAKKYYKMACFKNYDAGKFLEGIFEEQGNLDADDLYYETEFNKVYSNALFRLGNASYSMNCMNYAVRDWNDAALRRHREAQFTMGQYSEEVGNFELAKKYYTMAANQGHAGAQKNLNMLNGNMIENK